MKSIFMVYKLYYINKAAQKKHSLSDQNPEKAGEARGHQNRSYKPPYHRGLFLPSKE